MKPQGDVIIIDNEGSLIIWETYHARNTAHGRPRRKKWAKNRRLKNLPDTVWPPRAVPPLLVVRQLKTMSYVTELSTIRFASTS